MQQGSLFDSENKSNTNAETYELFGGGILSVWRRWFGARESEDFYNEIYTSVQWESPTIEVYGNLHAIPRKQAWYGDAASIMTYSGRTFYPTPWLPVLSQIRQRLEGHLNESFNSVLVNLYRDENDTVGWHADDEPELGVNPCIASISLGESRTFALKLKKKPTDASIPKRFNVTLNEGDLVVMRGSLQHFWHHSIPREKHACLPRINLTYRKLVS